MRIELATDADIGRAESTDKSEKIREQAFDEYDVLLNENKDAYKEASLRFREVVRLHPAPEEEETRHGSPNRPNKVLRTPISVMTYTEEDAISVLAMCYCWHSGGMVKVSGDGFLIESKGYDGNKKEGWSI